MQFADLIGKENSVSLMLPFIDPLELQQVIIHGVEHGGLWIETKNLNETFLKILKVQTAPKTLVFFVPYHQIKLGMSSIEKVALSERSFGV